MSLLRGTGSKWHAPRTTLTSPKAHLPPPLQGPPRRRDHDGGLALRVRSSRRTGISGDELPLRGDRFEARLPVKRAAYGGSAGDLAAHPSRHPRKQRIELALPRRVRRFGAKAP